MRGDQLSRQWRAIKASSNGLTVTEIAQREETGIRTIYRDLEAIQAGVLSLFTEKVDRANLWAFIDTFKFKIPPPFTLNEPMSRLAPFFRFFTIRGKAGKCWKGSDRL